MNSGLLRLVFFKLRKYRRPLRDLCYFGFPVCILAIGSLGLYTASKTILSKPSPNLVQEKPQFDLDAPDTIKQVLHAYLESNRLPHDNDSLETNIPELTELYYYGVILNDQERRLFEGQQNTDRSWSIHCVDTQTDTSFSSDLSVISTSDPSLTHSDIPLLAKAIALHASTIELEHYLQQDMEPNLHWDEWNGWPCLCIEVKDHHGLHSLTVHLDQTNMRLMGICASDFPNVKIALSDYKPTGKRIIPYQMNVLLNDFDYMQVRLSRIEAN